MQPAIQMKWNEGVSVKLRNDQLPQPGMHFKPDLFGANPAHSIGARNCIGRKNGSSSAPVALRAFHCILKSGPWVSGCDCGFARTSYVRFAGNPPRRVSVVAEALTGLCGANTFGILNGCAVHVSADHRGCCLWDVMVSSMCMYLGGVLSVRRLGYSSLFGS